jgi:Uma2 family endonuclease
MHEGGVEYVNGQLVEKPSSRKSSATAVHIMWVLQRYAKSTALIEVFDSSLGYQCFPKESSRFRKPDVSAIQREHLAGLDPDTDLMPIPADLAVEVISPRDTAYDVEERVEEYLANGFNLVWVVDPNTKTVIIHRRDGSVAKLHENDQITGESVLRGFTCRVAEFFASPGVTSAP